MQPNFPQEHHSPGYDKHWNILMQLWTRVDSLVQTKIAQAKEATTQEDQKAGNMKSEEIISLEMDHLEHSKTDCQITTCQVDKHQLSALITKNLEKISWRSVSSQQECDKQQHQSPPASHQEENVE